MSLYAIATIKANGDAVGIRLYNSKYDRMTDYSIQFILEQLRRGTKIENLGLKDNKLDWTCGAESRYPSINNGQLGNVKSVTVIYVTKGESKKYFMVDAFGNHGFLPEDQAILMAKRFGLTNCKLVTRGHTEFIQSISGNLAEVEVKPSKPYIKDDTLIIPVPMDGSVTTLDIPEMVHGVPTNILQKIIITPIQALNFIRTIRLPASFNRITNDLVSSFLRAQRIIVCGHSVEIDAKAFSRFVNLEEIYFREISYIGHKAFEGCEKLRKVYVEGTVKEIKDQAFVGCKSLDPNVVTEQKVCSYAGSNVFKGCKAETLHMSSYTNEVDRKSLNGIVGLKRIIWDGAICYIASRYFTGEGFDYPYLEFIVQPDTKVTYLNSERSDSFGDELDKRVTLKREYTISKDEQSIRLKSKLIGVSNSVNRLAKTKEEVLRAFSAASQNEINNALNRIVASSMYGAYRSMSCQLGSTHVNISPRYMRQDKVKRSYRVGNNHVVYYGGMCLIFIGEKEFVLRGLTSTRDCYYSSSVCFPIYQIPARAGHVDDIYTDVRTGEVTVRLRNKSVIRADAANY